ncbi:hypothetical protein EI94DRAFT_1707226 [Lactarius quietus]|nr:hypothetical protein EI94DRAFT_1707226 [Lactarius quietus]
MWCIENLQYCKQIAYTENTRWSAGKGVALVILKVTVALAQAVGPGAAGLVLSPIGTPGHSQNSSSSGSSSRTVMPLTTTHPQENAAPVRLPTQTPIKGMAKECQRITNVNMGDAGYAGSVGPASSLDSHMAIITPPYLQSHSGRSEQSCQISHGSLSSPVRDEPFSAGAMSFLNSESLDEHFGSPVECDNDMVDVISESGGSSRGDIDIPGSNTNTNDSLDVESDANDTIMEGDEEDYKSGGAISCKKLLSSLATDIKRIGKQPQDAPSTKDDIHMILGHLHRAVKLEKNQTTNKETRPIPEERTVPLLSTDNQTSGQCTHCETCQCNIHPSDLEVLVKTCIKSQSKNGDPGPVACLKVRFTTNSRETKSRKRGRPSA